MSRRPASAGSGSKLDHLRLTDEKSLAAINIANLPKQVLKMARKSPGEFGFRSLSKKTAERDEVEYEKDFNTDVWLRRERYVNQIMYAVLLALPPAALSAVLMGLTGMSMLGAPALCRGSSRKLGKFIGEPDFVVLDKAARVAVLGEIKIGATRSNDRYSFHQYSKYMLYGALFRAAGIARDVVHLVVAPKDDAKALCKDYAKWTPHIGEGGELTSSPQAIPVRYKGQKEKSLAYSSRESWITYAEGFLRDPRHQQANGYDDRDVDRLRIAANAPALVPACVVTWNRLCGEITRACETHHAAHLAPAIESLRMRGNGESD